MYVVSVADKDDEGVPYTMYVYGPFDKHEDALHWTKNFPMHVAQVLKLIRPTYNAD